MTSEELTSEYHRLFDAIIAATGALSQQRPETAYSILRQALWFPQSPPPKPYAEVRDPA